MGIFDKSLARVIQRNFKNNNPLLHDGKFGEKSYEEAWKLFRKAKKGSDEYNYWKQVISWYDNGKINYRTILQKKTAEETAKRDAQEFEKFANKDPKDEWKIIPSDPEAREDYFNKQIGNFISQTEKQIQNNFQKAKPSLTDGHFGRNSYKEALHNWYSAAEGSKEKGYWELVMNKYAEKFGGNNYVVKSPDEDMYASNSNYAPDRGEYSKNYYWVNYDYNRKGLTKGYRNYSAEDLVKGNIDGLYRPSSYKVLRVYLNYPIDEQKNIEKPYKGLSTWGMMLYGTPQIEGNYKGKGGIYIVVPKSDKEGYALLTEAGEYIGDLNKGDFKNGSWRGYNDMDYYDFLDYIESDSKNTSFKIGGKLKLNLNL